MIFETSSFLKYQNTFEAKPHTTKASESINNTFNDLSFQKKFQRSQPKEQKLNYNNSYTQRPSVQECSNRSYERENIQNSTNNRKTNKSQSFTYQKTTQLASYSKYIPNSLIDQSTKGNTPLTSFFPQSSKTAASTGIPRNEHYQKKISKEKSAFFPFQVLIGNPMTPSTKDQKQECYSKVKQPQTLTKLDSSFSLIKNHIHEVGELSTFSTEPSICDFGSEHKIFNSTCQEYEKQISNKFPNDNKKIRNKETQTVHYNFELKIQDLEYLVNKLKMQNNSLQQQLCNTTKQKDILLKSVQEVDQKTTHRKPSFCQTYTPKSLNSSHISSREIELEKVIKQLTNEINELRQFTKVFPQNKFDEIFNQLKQENAWLKKQLQGISLRCRVLEKQNIQIRVFEMENRKFRNQIKQLKQNIRDSESEVDRLKKQNKRLRMRQFAALNNPLQTPPLCVRSSDADSLNLSFSMVRE